MIESSGDNRGPADVLVDWREAERRVEGALEGSAAWHRARVGAERLADEYQQLVAERVDEAQDPASKPSSS